jgi:hypothetical protein
LFFIKINLEVKKVFTIFASVMSNNATYYPDFDDYYNTIMSNISLVVINFGSVENNPLREFIFSMYHIDIPANKATVLVESLLRNFKQKLF